MYNDRFDYHSLINVAFRCLAFQKVILVIFSIHQHRVWPMRDDRCHSNDLLSCCSMLMSKDLLMNRFHRHSNDEEVCVTMSKIWCVTNSVRNHFLYFSISNDRPKEEKMTEYRNYSLMMLEQVDWSIDEDVQMTMYRPMHREIEAFLIELWELSNNRKRKCFSIIFTTRRTILFSRA